MAFINEEEEQPTVEGEEALINKEEEQPTAGAEDAIPEENEVVAEVDVENTEKSEHQETSDAEDIKIVTEEDENFDLDNAFSNQEKQVNKKTKPKEKKENRKDQKKKSTKQITAEAEQSAHSVYTVEGEDTNSKPVPSRKPKETKKAKPKVDAKKTSKLNSVQFEVTESKENVKKADENDERNEVKEKEKPERSSSKQIKSKKKKAGKEKTTDIDEEQKQLLQSRKVSMVNSPHISVTYGEGRRSMRKSHASLKENELAAINSANSGQLLPDSEITINGEKRTKKTQHGTKFKSFKGPSAKDEESYDSSDDSETQDEDEDDRGKKGKRKNLEKRSKLFNQTGYPSKRTTSDIDKEEHPDEELIKDGKDKQKKKKAVSMSATQEEVKAEEPKIAEKIEAEPKKKSKGPKTEKPTKEKQKKKKPKLSAKEEKRIEEERRAQAEQEAIKAAEEERLRLIAVRKEMIAKDKKEIAQQQVRAEYLEDSMQIVKDIQKAGLTAAIQDKEKEEWIQYLNCDGLPNPGSVAEMNTYLHLWEKDFETVTVEKATHRTMEICKLLEDLQTLLDDPIDVPERIQEDWKWIRSMFREHQEKNLDFCTYRLLRDIKNKLRRIDIPTADFRLAEKNFCLCVWVLVQLPIPTPNPRTPPRPRIKMEWPEMKMDVLFPTSLNCDTLALRAMYVKYDHLSDRCLNYNPPPIPPSMDQDLAMLTSKEWYTKMRYKYDNRVIDTKEPQEVVQEDGTIVKVEAEAAQPIPEGVMPPIVPYQKLEPTASEYAISIERNQYENDRKALMTIVDDKVVNLRRYVILGGVYYLNLFQQPKQPQEMVSFEIFITSLQLPCTIKEAPFYVEYIPPPPPAPGVRRPPEEIEEEMVKQEKEFDKLIFIELMLPTDVFWMDVPIACHWDYEKQHWSTADVHDFKHIEEKGMVTFRTGRFGPFAIATYRYSNLPYQAWEVRPEKNGSVTLQITAAILMVEFNVKDHLVCMTQLQNAPNKSLDHHLNIYYKLSKLIRLLRESGVDLFPWFDTFCYVEGTCEKNWPMEKHLYYNMAQASVAYNFSWSRWNMLADYRSIVMQMRMYRFDRPKQISYSMCLVTPLKAALIDCTEVSAQFTDNPVEGMKFAPDLNYLIKLTGTIAAKTKIAQASQAMVNTLANLFIGTRFHSFS